MSAPFWTDEDKRQLAEYAAAGLPASQIEKKFEGRTRSSVCGVAHRMGIKLMGPNGGNTNRKGTRKPRTKSNVVPFKPKPKPRPIKPEYSEPKPVASKKPKLSVVSNNVDLMVADWLAKNGGPRRFERGMTSSAEWIRVYLGGHGYSFAIWRRNTPRLNGRVTTWPKIHDLVDRFREAEGLPTLKVRAG